MYYAVLLFKSDHYFTFLFVVFFLYLFQLVSSDGLVMVSNTVLEKTNADLQSLRMSVFKQLKPKLRCKLGESSEYHGMH